jgi:hypothetical protein
MTKRSRNTCRLLVLLALTAGCASPGYSPPEREASERCPIGEVWVCRDRYPSRLETEGQSPMICMCQDMQAVR